MAPERSAPEPLPVVRSLLSPTALAEMVALAYGLAAVRCKLIKATSRDVYRVESTSGPRILIVYRHGSRSEAEIRAELDLLDVLSAHGVAVAQAIPARSGERTIALAAPEGTRYAVLFHLAVGEPMIRAPGPDTARRYGEMVAQVHAVTDAWSGSADIASRRSPLDASFLIDRPLDLMTRILEPSSSELADLMRAAHTMREHLVLLPKHPPGYGMIHGDVIPTNIVLGPGGVLTLLDFDFCGPGWRAFDVATFLRDARERQATDGTAFLDGYQEMRRLSGWELKALPLFMAIRSLFRLGNWGPRLDEWGTSARPAGLIAGHLAEITQDLSQVTR